MRIFRHFTGVPSEAQGAAVAIGNFDGVHLGHQAVIAEAGRIARELDVPHAILTFEPHPRRVFQPDLPPFRLTPLRNKAHVIGELGVDLLFVIHFDLEFAKRSAESFVADVLVRGLGVAHVVVGRGFAFGHRRRGNAALLARLGEEHGFGVTRIEPIADPAGEIYSSSRIRGYLAEGRPAAAARLLGRWWEIEGRVERGSGRGQDLGYPTANVHFESDYLVPGTGIYAVRAGIEEEGRMVWRDGAASFGVRPTFGGDTLVLEVNLFDFAGDLYGRHLRLAFVDYLRDEKKFDGPEALKAQMAEDCRLARKVLAAAGERPQPAATVLSATEQRA